MSSPLKSLPLLGPAIWLVASCAQLAGVEERTPCEGLTGSTGACGTCLGESCCKEALACRDDASCSKLAECLDACADGNQECRSSCRSKNPLGLRSSAFAALVACTTTRCDQACELDCGGYLHPSLGCASCMAASCCGETAQCSTQAECVALAYCQQPCAGSDPACRGDCQRQYPDGKEGARALAECAATECKTKCGYEALFEPDDWSCMDNLTGPGSGTVTLDLRVQSVETLGATTDVVGALVKCCGPDDELCSTVLAEGTTGSDGHVLLELDYGFDGYFSVEGSGLTNELAFVDPPLVADRNRTEAEFTPSALAYIMKVATVIDPQRGSMFLRATDCKGANLKDITFQISKLGGGAINESAVQYYGGVAIPVSDWNGGTPGSGEGGWINLDPGAYEVVLVRRDTRECIAKKKLFVRASFETFWGAIPKTCE